MAARPWSSGPLTHWDWSLFPDEEAEHETLELDPRSPRRLIHRLALV
jgi:hypothetical protein